MPVIKVDLGEVQGIVGPGAWLLEVEDVSASKTRQAGHDMLRVRNRVVEPEENNGQAHFENLVQIPEAAWTTDRFLTAVGIDVPEDKAERAAFEFDTDAIVGNQFVAILEPQKDNPQYTQTAALLTVAQAEAQGLEYGPAPEDSDEDSDEG